jgi:hypothetical protein
MGIIAILCGMVAFVSFLTFVAGIIMQFSEKNRKLGLQMILYSVIAFVIGFGTCFASLTL